MESVAIRVFSFSILPVIIAAGHLGLDRTSRSRERRLEILLLYLFGVGVAGSGIGGFFGHFFISDSVAESIGWPTGNPFQLEVGIANLAIGILGIVAMGRRDGFREATVIAVTIFGVGATVIHVIDVIESGNLAPGNTIQNVSNLLRPALLIAFLAASRRAERSPDSEAHTSGFDRWRGPRVRAAGFMERRRRVRRRLCHRSARHRYPRWDPGWRRSGRHRRSWFIGGNQRAPHLKTATTPCLAHRTGLHHTTTRPLPGHHRGRKGRPWALPTKILRRLVPLNVVSTLLGYTSVMTAGLAAT
jgi:Family of unknown function (DUF6790)